MLGQLSYKKLALEWLGACLIALIVSFFAGNLLLCLLVANALLLCWHFYQLRKFSRWLWEDKGIDPPQASGSWFSISYGLYRMRLQQMRQKKHLLSLLNYSKKAANTIPDAIILCQKSGHLLWCNKMAGFLLGLRLAQDKGLQISNLIRIPEFNHYLSQQDYAQPLTLCFPSEKHIEFRIVSLQGEGSFLILARDVTQRYQLDTMRQNFFANVSHELRVPLTVIQGYIEILQQEQERQTPVGEKAFSAIEQQISRLDDLVTQLMLLSRIEAAPAIDFNQKVSVSSIIDEIYQEVIEINARHQSFLLQVDPELSVFGDAEQLRSALSNLFYNAVVHNPEGTIITVSWQSDQEGQAVFSIEDNGSGIAPEHIDHLTERFYRVDHSRSRKTGRSGLGLAIVKQVLNNHHTKLQITSTLGKGSQFRFSLPKSW